MRDDTEGALLRALRPAAPCADDEGVVLAVDGPLARVGGLGAAATGDLVAFGDAGLGLVAELRAAHAVVALLDAPARLRVGARASLRGAPTLPVDDVCGRVLDPLGRPLDGGCAPGGPRTPHRADPRRRWGPSPVPGVFTGLPLVDVTTPFREGVAHAILGPARTGRSALVDDLLAAGLAAGMRAVLVLTTGTAGEAARRVAALRERGLLAGCAVVAASAGDPCPRVALAPRAGAAIARRWYARGERALLLWDDVSPWEDAAGAYAAALGRPFDRGGAPLSLAGELGAVLACAESRPTAPRTDAIEASLTVVAVGGERPGAATDALGSLAEVRMVTDATLRARGVYPALDPSRCKAYLGVNDPRYPYLRRALRLRSVHLLHHWRAADDAVLPLAASLFAMLSVAPGAPLDPVASFARAVLAFGPAGRDPGDVQAQVDALRPQLAPLLDGGDRDTWDAARRLVEASTGEPPRPPPVAPSARGPYRG